MEKKLTNYQPTEKSVVIYKSEDDTIQHEVQLVDETVWLTRPQMAKPFDTTPQNVTMHVGNIYDEEELYEESTSKDFLLVQNEGGNEKRRKAKFYNLDVIISVGYRVKSKRGTQFRKWANAVLKDYLLKGYAIDTRIMHLEERIDNRLIKHENQINELTNKVDFFVKSSLPPVQGVFCDGQIFDAYKFVTDLIKRAKSSIILIDNYIDETVLTMLDNRNAGVSATIYTARFSEKMKLALTKHNSQYQPINIEVFNKSHDRFLIIDDDVYLIGASLKDLGKKMFGFSKMEIGKERIMLIL